MNKFVTARWWLLGGLIAAALMCAAASLGASTQEPIPVPIWTSEIVSASGYSHALALDSLDRPHLLYIDSATASLNHAERLDDGWHMTELATFTIQEADVSFDMAISPTDEVCIVYATAPASIWLGFDSTLRFACTSASGWHIFAIDDGGRSARLALDSAGNPHIALVQGQSAVYLWREGGQWHKEIAGTDAAYMGRVWLLIDSADRPRVIYTGSEGTFSATRDAGGAWTSAPLDAPGLQAARLDAADRLWLTRAVSEDGGGHPPMYHSFLYLGWPEATGPAWELIEASNGASYRSDLALSAGGPHVVYANPADNGVHYVWWVEGERQLHDPGATSDAEVHLALGSDGQPRLSYRQDGALHLVTRSILLLDEALYLPGVIKK